MARKQLPYKAGDAIAVPLPDGGYALGAIARADGRGGILAYFFGERKKEVPSSWKIPHPKEAIWIPFVGHLGLLEGKWRVIPVTSGERPQSWPVPAFGNFDPLSGRAWRIEYDAENPFSTLGRRTQVSKEEADALPREGAAGDVFAEQRLARLLRGKPVSA